VKALPDPLVSLEQRECLGSLGSLGKPAFLDLLVQMELMVLMEHQDLKALWDPLALQALLDLPLREIAL
jgi:hypothetical protein